MRIIYYDLETTGLHPMEGPNGVEIVQIGATSRYRGNATNFDEYLLPTMPVTQTAVNIHGLTNRILDAKLRQGHASYIENGLKMFVDYIDGITLGDKEGTTVLVSCL